MKCGSKKGLDVGFVIDGQKKKKILTGKFHPCTRVVRPVL